MNEALGLAVGSACGLWVLRIAFYLIERWDRKRGKTNGFGITKGSFHF